MKNRLFTLAAALTLAAVVGGFYAAPVLAQAVKAALVKNVDERGRVPYQSAAACSASGGPAISCDILLTKVPVGTRLVLEHISSNNQLPPGATFYTFSTTHGTMLPPKLFASFPGSTIWTGNDDLLEYFEAGETPKVSVFATATSLTANVLATGYLVTLP